MEEVLKDIKTLSMVPIGIRYIYSPYKGEIACIPEWYLCKYHPESMLELETIAEIWLERNKRGDYGKI